MTPIRSINYVTWAIWGAVMLVSVHHAGWVRVFYIEGGAGIPLTVEFFVLPDGFFAAAKCLTVDEGSAVRYLTEMFMVPSNMALIGLAIAVPRFGLRTATAALSLITVGFTFEFSGYHRLHCPLPAGYFNEDISHLVGITLYDLISLVPRILYVLLFFVTPVKWSPVGHWTRPAPWTRINARRNP